MLITEQVSNLKKGEKPMKLRKKPTSVIKSNAIIEGRFNITLVEMKLFLSVLTQISPADTDFRVYRVYYRDLFDKMDVSGNMYDYIKASCKSLVDKTLVIETGKGHLITSFFSSIETYHNESYIDFCFDPKLKPYLLQLKSNFTVYDIRNILPCKSVYSIRIYQLLKQFEKIGNRTLELDELKEMLGLSKNAYTQWINFKTKVISPSEKELKKYSDIFFTYTKIKRGRKIDSIKFTINRKKQQRLFDAKNDSPYLTFEQVEAQQKALDEMGPMPYCEWAKG